MRTVRSFSKTEGSLVPTWCIMYASLPTGLLRILSTKYEPYLCLLCYSQQNPKHNISMSTK